jgi:hypothetical protein
MLTGYKTLIVASLITVLGVVQGLDWVHLVTSPGAAGWIVSIIGVVMMILRAMNNTSMMTKTSPAPSPHSLVDRVIPK